MSKLLGRWFRDRTIRSGAAYRHATWVRPRLAVQTLEARDVPATFTVTNAGDSGAGSLRAAIILANADTITDTINFDAAAFAATQTITLTAALPTITTNVNIAGKATGSAAPVIDGVGSFRVFNVSGTGTLTVNVNDLTVANGFISGATGGGVLNADESVTFTSVTFSKNKAASTGGQGGAAAISGTTAGTLTFNNCLFDQNATTGSSSASGGAVYAAGGAAAVQVNFNASTLTANTAGANGGAFYAQSSVTLNVQNTSFKGNAASLSTGIGGGAVAINSTSSVTITGSTFDGNTAPAGANTNGGAVTITGTSTLTVRNSTFANNSAPSGGALALGGSTTATITNTTVVSNTATGTSGGGGGIYRSGLGPVTLTSSIVAKNSGSVTTGATAFGNDIAFNLSGTITANANVIGIGNKGNFTLSGTNQTGIDTMPLDPLLDPLGSYGGPTQTFRLQTGSPAIDQGSNPAALTTDQRGLPRESPAGKPDVGAYEFLGTAPIATLVTAPVITAGATSATFTVVYFTETGTINTTTLGGNDFSVSGTPIQGAAYGPGAAALVSVSPGGSSGSQTVTYSFAAPGGTFDGADNGTYSITPNANSVQNSGGFGNAAGAVGTFAVSFPTTYVVTTLVDSVNAADGVLSLREAIFAANSDVSQDTITFTGLNGSIALAAVLPTVTGSLVIQGAGSTVTVDGNGLYRPFTIDNAAGTITVAFNSLTITKGSAALGGAVNVTDESVTFTNVVISANTSTSNGGGVYVSGGGTVAFTNSTVANNAAGGTNGQGGGLYLTTSAVVTVASSTFSGNTAAARGGAAYFNGGGQVTIDQGTFSGNAAGTASLTAGGGALSFFAPTVTIRNSTFTNNAAGSSTAGEGGGGIRNASSSASVTLVSTIVAANTAGTAYKDYANINAAGTSTLGTVNATNSLIGVAGAGSGLALTTDVNNITGSPANPLDPGLLALASNGGPVQTHALAAVSLARNTGSNPAGFPFDARGPGFARERPTGSPDIGAFEAPSPTPGAVLTSAPNVTTTGGTKYTFTVTYSDDTAISAASVNGNTKAVIVTGPNSFTATLTSAVIDTNTNGTPRTVTYTFTAPGGTFDAADNGSYQLVTTATAADQAKNTSGVGLPSKLLGTFAVQLTGSYIVTTTSDSGAGSLRSAIANANAQPGTPDTITFDPTIFGIAQTITLTTGELTITDNVVIQGTGATSLTIDGSGKAGQRIFNVANATAVITVAVNSLTLAKGNLTGTSGGDVGGAVFLNGNESLSFTNVTFFKNSAAFDGGAISVNDAAATLTLTGCTFDQNSSTFQDGGAINLQAAATLNVQNTTFTGNTATTGGGGGGAIYFNAGGVANITGTTFTGNKAGDRGGAIYFAGPINAVVSNSTFDGNALIGTSVSTTAGGAIYINSQATTFSLVNSTVTGNTIPTGKTGAGIGIENTFGTPTYTITNSIVAGNVTTDATPVASDIVSKTTAAAATITANALAYTAATNVTFTGSATSGFNAAANLDPLASNGGPTQTRALKAGSTAIDAGTATSTLAYDQRGVGFARVSNGKADLGAFEVQAAAASDTIAPTASGTFNTVTTRKGATYTFTVTLADNVAVNAGSVQGADFSVTGPNGYSQTATLVSLSPNANGSPLVATLSVPAPGGSFDVSDNGTYTVGVTGSITDTAATPNAVALGSLGTFAVQAPVSVESVVTKLSDGTTTSLTTGGQRSLIPNLVVTFDGIATGANLAASYKLLNTSTNATVALTATTTTVGGKTVATITPVAPLANAFYTFTAFGSAVTTANVAPTVVGLDGDNNGTAGGDYVLTFHRFAGDVTGDTAVDGDDLAQLAAAFNSVQGDTNYRAYLDLDNDGAVDGNDLAIFAQSFQIGILS